MTQPSSNNNQESISRDRALEMLTNVFPDLQQQWRSYIQSEYQDYSEERLDYIDIGVIISYIVEKKKRDDISGFGEFFNRVEKALVYGDNDTKGLIVVGLLEGIQNVCGLEIDYYTGFSEWLKPETRKAWDEVIEFWEGKKPEHNSRPLDT